MDIAVCKSLSKVGENPSWQVSQSNDQIWRTCRDLGTSCRACCDKVKKNAWDELVVRHSSCALKYVMLESD